jgi:hypothetical protein
MQCVERDIDTAAGICLPAALVPTSIIWYGMTIK